MNQHFFITQPGNARPSTAALLYYGNPVTAGFCPSIQYWTHRQSSAKRFSSIFTACNAAALLVQARPALAGKVRIIDNHGRRVSRYNGISAAPEQPTDAEFEFVPLDAKPTAADLLDIAPGYDEARQADTPPE